MRKSRIIPLGLALIILFLDQYTKLYITSNFLHGETRPIIENFFNLVYVKNDGAAWNILSGQRFLLIFISFLVLFFLLIKVDDIFLKTKFHNILFGLILGGIPGNLIDRIKYGWVIDFLDFQFGTYHYPSFNIADSAICLSVILYLFHQWFSTKKVNKA